MGKGVSRRGVWALLRYIRQLRLPVHAAHTGYFLILSLFPGLVLLLELLHLTGLDIHSLLALLEGVIPQRFLPEAELIILNTYEADHRALVGVSAVTALWSSGRGIYGLRMGLNAVYAARETRSYLHVRLLSALYTGALLVMLVLTLALHIFGTGLLEWLAGSDRPFFRFLAQVVDLRFFLLVFLQTALFTAMFCALPNRRSAPGQSLPGALLASLGWLLFSRLFSLYTDRVPGLSRIFGEPYTLALAMLWLYSCIHILLFGGLLNRLLMEGDFRK